MGYGLFKQDEDHIGEVSDCFGLAIGYFLLQHIFNFVHNILIHGD